MAGVLLELVCDTFASSDIAEPCLQVLFTMMQLIALWHDEGPNLRSIVASLLSILRSDWTYKHTGREMDSSL